MKAILPVPSIDFLITRLNPFETTDHDTLYQDALEQISKILIEDKKISSSPAITSEMKFNTIMAVAQIAAIDQNNTMYSPTARMIWSVSKPDYFKNLKPLRQRQHLNLVINMATWNKFSPQEEKDAVLLISGAKNCIPGTYYRIKAGHKVNVTDTMFNMAPTLKSQDAKERLYKQQSIALIDNMNSMDIETKEMHRLLYRYAQQPEIENPKEIGVNFKEGMHQILVHMPSSRKEDPFLKNIMTIHAKNSGIENQDVIQIYEKKYSGYRT